MPWLVWLSGLSANLQTKGLLVWFPVRAHAWVAGHVPGGELVRGNHTSQGIVDVSFPLCLPSPLSGNKQIKSFKKNK